MTEPDDDRSAMNRLLRGAPSARESQARLGRRFFGGPEPEPQEPQGGQDDADAGRGAPEGGESEPVADDEGVKSMRIFDLDEL